MKEDFKKLLENNKDKDWNNLIFRETMVDAFRFCANGHIEKSKLEAKKEVFDDYGKNVYPELRLLNKNEGEMLMKEWQERHLSTFADGKSDIIADKQNPQEK